MSRDHISEEARRRVDDAAAKLASAIRLGVDPLYARRAIDSAVRQGAEQLAEDTIEAWEARL